MNRAWRLTVSAAALAVPPAADESSVLGVLDALRNLLDGRLEEAPAQARVLQRLPDLERATGQTLFPSPQGTKP